MIPQRSNTIGEKGARRWVYPQEVSGFHTRLRFGISVVLFTLFYAAPWITWNGAPFVQLSFSTGSFYILGQKLFIYELYNFVFLGLLLAATLFFVSALYGRIWCGYACPQTLFLEQICRRIETFFQGNALSRKAADQKPLTLKRVGAKVATQISFILVCLSFAWTLVALFAGSRNLGFVPQGEPAWLMVLVVGSLAYLDAAFLREQFCLMLCPYARFQGVLQDPGTRTLGYDSNRGEPRAKGVRTPGNTSGDCIDCGFCVRVCPTAMDIRHGTGQLDCISCGRCIDACNTVMASLKKPLGLIRYDVEARLNPWPAIEPNEKIPGKNEAPLPPRPPLLRPRILLYGGVCFALAALGMWRFFERADLHIKLLNVNGIPYVAEQERIKNIFTLKLVNQRAEPRTFVVKLAALSSGLHLDSPSEPLVLPAGGDLQVPVLVSIEKKGPLPAAVFIELHEQGSAQVWTVQRPFVTP